MDKPLAEVEDYLKAREEMLKKQTQARGNVPA